MLANNTLKGRTLLKGEVADDLLYCRPVGDTL
jgi:hypothetical protein